MSISLGDLSHFLDKFIQGVGFGSPYGKNGFVQFSHLRCFVIFPSFVGGSIVLVAGYSRMPANFVVSGRYP